MKTLLALLLLAAVCGGGRVERQMEHPWGRWQPGAWIEFRTGSPDTPTSSWSVERSQLVRCTDEGYVLTTPREGAARSAARERSHGWGFGGYAHVMPDARLVGRESVRVGAQELACEVWEGSWQEGEETFVGRSWLSPSFALPVRARMTSPSGGFELVLVEPQDFVIMGAGGEDGERGERKLKAARYEGTGRNQSAAVAFRQWLTLDVPGGVARMESVFQEQGQTKTVVREVTAFRCVPVVTR